MEIEIIENVFNELFNILKNKNIRKIETDIDYFWNIDISDAIKFEKKEPTAVVESISEDYAAICEVNKNKRNPNVIDIEKLANIIRIIAYEIEKSDINIV